MESVSRNSWSEVELGERRVLPALPASDADLGEIRWERWERSPVMTHIDPSCGSCDYPGPLAHALGMTLHQDPPRRKLLKRSAIAKGQRPVAGPLFTPEPRWIFTHTSTRCQACDEMIVWCITGRRTRCQKCAAVVPEALRGTRAKCPACRRVAHHEVPGGVSARRDTWCEVAYNPPRTAQVAPPPPRRPPPQAETLF